MLSFFPAENHSAEIPPALSMERSADVSGSPQLLDCVGALPHDQRAAEDRLDRLIADLDAKSVAAMKAGDPQGARLYVDQMYAAIHSRSPEHQARKTAELEQRIAEQADYFGYRGQLDREALERRESRA